MLQSTKLQFDIPEWGERDFRILSESEQVAKSIGSSAGQGSSKIEGACRRLLSAVIKRNGGDFLSNISTSTDVRALTYLLSSSPEFVDNVNLTQPLLDRMIEIRQPMSRLSFMQMIRAFFVNFDFLAEKDELNDWAQFISRQLSEYESGRCSSELEIYAQYRELIFSAYGPARIVNYAKSNNIDFDALIEKFRLTGFTDGRYLTLCQFQYYLVTLKEIPVGEDHPVLSEVCNTAVFNSPYTEEKQLGHVILEILIDRADRQEIGEKWQATILTIAGDPRVPKSAARYQQWWSILGEQRIEKMRGWLSRFDLKLFLNVLEQSAKDSSNADMERMFVSRKIFMEGLLEQGLVRNSRLILSRSAERYVNKHYNKNEMPEYSTIKEGSASAASVLYLDVAGFHMVEGSHSFKIKVLNKFPALCKLLDYANTEFLDRSLRMGLAEQYVSEFGRDGGYIESSHHAGLSWQATVIQYFQKNGIKINPELVLSPQNYREFKWRYGFTYDGPSASELKLKKFELSNNTNVIESKNSDNVDFNYDNSRLSQVKEHHGKVEIMSSGGENSELNSEEHEYGVDSEKFERIDLNDPTKKFGVDTSGFSARRPYKVGFDEGAVQDDPLNYVDKLGRPLYERVRQVLAEHGSLTRVSITNTINAKKEHIVELLRSQSGRAFVEDENGYWALNSALSESECKGDIVQLTKNSPAPEHDSDIKTLSKELNVKPTHASQVIALDDQDPLFMALCELLDAEPNLSYIEITNKLLFDKRLVRECLHSQKGKAFVVDHFGRWNLYFSVDTEIEEAASRPLLDNMDEMRRPMIDRVFELISDVSHLSRTDIVNTLSSNQEETKEILELLDRHNGKTLMENEKGCWAISDSYNTILGSVEAVDTEIEKTIVSNGQVEKLLLEEKPSNVSETQASSVFEHANNHEATLFEQVYSLIDSNTNLTRREIHKKLPGKENLVNDLLDLQKGNAFLMGSDGRWWIFKSRKLSAPGETLASHSHKNDFNYETPTFEQVFDLIESERNLTRWSIANRLNAKQKDVDTILDSHTGRIFIFDHKGHWWINGGYVKE